jgi:hypothetical protein
MLENPMCPRCGKTGKELTLVGRQDSSGIFQAGSPRSSALYAYQCQCGMTFTHKLWDERAADKWK